MSKLRFVFPILKRTSTISVSYSLWDIVNESFHNGTTTLDLFKEKFSPETTIILNDHESVIRYFMGYFRMGICTPNGLPPSASTLESMSDSQAWVFNAFSFSKVLNPTGFYLYFKGAFRCPFHSVLTEDVNFVNLESKPFLFNSFIAYQQDVKFLAFPKFSIALTAKLTEKIASFICSKGRVCFVPFEEEVNVLYDVPDNVFAAISLLAFKKFSEINNNDDPTNHAINRLLATKDYKKVMELLDIPFGDGIIYVRGL